MKSLTLILEPTDYALSMNVARVSAWNRRAQGWTTVPEWIEWMDEDRTKRLWKAAIISFNDRWATMRVATKEEVIGLMLSNKPETY